MMRTFCVAMLLTVASVLAFPGGAAAMHQPLGRSTVCTTEKSISTDAPARTVAVAVTLDDVAVLRRASPAEMGDRPADTAWMVYAIIPVTPGDDGHHGGKSAYDIACASQYIT